LALVLDPQLSKLPVARRRDVGRVRKTKVQPLLFEETDTRGDAVLFVLREVVPPLVELVRVLDRPRHDRRGI